MSQITIDTATRSGQRAILSALSALGFDLVAGQTARRVEAKRLRASLPPNVDRVLVFFDGATTWPIDHDGTPDLQCEIDALGLKGFLQSHDVDVPDGSDVGIYVIEGRMSYYTDYHSNETDSQFDREAARLATSDDFIFSFLGFMPSPFDDPTVFFDNVDENIADDVVEKIRAQMSALEDGVFSGDTI